LWWASSVVLSLKISPFLFPSGAREGNEAVFSVLSFPVTVRESKEREGYELSTEKREQRGELVGREREREAGKEGRSTNDN
jgi:hypothetical protein